MHLPWDLSSVGLERCLDRAEVMGSNPLDPTFPLSYCKLYLMDNPISFLVLLIIPMLFAISFLLNGKNNTRTEVKKIAIENKNPGLIKMYLI